MRRLGRIIFAAATVALLGVVALAGWAAWSICSYASLTEAVPADAAIVLGAAAWGEEPSPVFRERINHALDLYRQGLVRKIIFTGAQDDASEPPEALVARRYAIAQGIPEGGILVETRSRITEQNLFYAREVAADAGLRSFLIVSDPLHMRRAMLIARDLGMDAHSSPTPTTRYRSLGSRLEFLAREVLFYLGYLVERETSEVLGAGDFRSLSEDFGSLPDCGAGRLANDVRLLCTKAWPVLYQVLTLQVGDGVRVWGLTADAAWLRRRAELFLAYGRGCLDALRYAPPLQAIATALAVATDYGIAAYWMRQGCLLTSVCRIPELLGGAPRLQRLYCQVFGLRGREGAEEFLRGYRELAPEIQRQTQSDLELEVLMRRAWGSTGTRASGRGRPWSPGRAGRPPPGGCS